LFQCFSDAKRVQDMTPVVDEMR